MNVASLFRRRPATPQPSPALIALTSAVDGLEAAIVNMENAIEAGADARLQCLGMSTGDMPTIGTAHRTSAIEVTAATFALTRAMSRLDACRQHPPRADERDAAGRCLSRIVALRARMDEALGTATAIAK